MNTDKLIDAAEAYADKYDGDERPDVKTDVLNAFYAGAEFGNKHASDIHTLSELKKERFA